jgi:hypothetical protein
MQTFWLLEYLRGSSAQQPTTSNLVDGTNGHRNRGIRRRNSFRRNTEQKEQSSVEMYRNYRDKMEAENSKEVGIDEGPNNS